MKSFFIENKTFCHGQQFGQIHFGAFGVISVNLSVPILVHIRSPLSMFCINQPLFLQKTKPVYPNLKNLFGIWVAKNQGFSHCVAIARASKYWQYCKVVIRNKSYWVTFLVYKQHQNDDNQIRSDSNQKILEGLFTSAIMPTNVYFNKRVG